MSHDITTILAALVVIAVLIGLTPNNPCPHGCERCKQDREIKRQKDLRETHNLWHNPEDFPVKTCRWCQGGGTGDELYRRK